VIYSPLLFGIKQGQIPFLKEDKASQFGYHFINITVQTLWAVSE
jgi:hypothetical protein